MQVLPELPFVEDTPGRLLGIRSSVERRVSSGREISEPGLARTAIGIDVSSLRTAHRLTEFYPQTLTATIYNRKRLADRELDTGFINRCKVS